MVNRHDRALSWRITALLALAAGPLAAAEPPGDFVERRGTGFVLEGEPFPVVGVNCYYLMVNAASPNLRRVVDEVLDDAAFLGATVVRTWAFHDGPDGWNALQTAPGVYSESVLQGLDYVLKEANERGLRVLLTLVNNWNDYGGMNQYVDWSATAAVHDDFYTDPSCLEWYRGHATKVLTRVNFFTGAAYRDDPTIFGWELANEPRAEEKGRAVLDAWIAEMAAHVKRVDARHLLSTGSEGFYGPGEASRNPQSWMATRGVDFIANHSHAAIDFASFHSWPDHWSLSRAQTTAWVRNHFEEAARSLGKPVVLGEYGKKQPVATRNETFRDAFDALLGELGPGNSSGGILLWMLYHNASPDYDGFGVYYPGQAHESTVALLKDGHLAVTEKIAPSAGPRFLRADANCDGRVDLADPIHTLEHLFREGPASCCSEAADANGDGGADLADAVFTLFFQFAAGSPPPPPYPECGEAPAGVGCRTSPGCARLNLLGLNPP